MTARRLATACLLALAAAACSEAASPGSPGPSGSPGSASEGDGAVLPPVPWDRVEAAIGRPSPAEQAQLDAYGLPRTQFAAVSFAVLAPRDDAILKRLELFPQSHLYAGAALVPDRYRVSLAGVRTDQPDRPIAIRLGPGEAEAEWVAFHGRYRIRLECLDVLEEACLREEPIARMAAESIWLGGGPE